MTSDTGRAPQRQLVQAQRGIAAFIQRRQLLAFLLALVELGDMRVERLRECLRIAEVAIQVDLDEQ